MQPRECFLLLSGGHRQTDMIISMRLSHLEQKPLFVNMFRKIYPEDACILRVKDSARALGELASAFYGHPSRRFKLVGVTGTNGKTTTVTLLHQSVYLHSDTKLVVLRPSGTTLEMRRLRPPTPPPIPCSLTAS